MKKRMVVAIAALIVVFGGIFAYKAVGNYFMNQYFADFQPPPSTVSTIDARSETWQPGIGAAGVLSAVQGVDVSSEVSGKVAAIRFESGQAVRKGDVLVQLDDSIEQAQLPGLQARANLARINLARTRKLLEKELTSAENLDTVHSELQQAESAIAHMEATIAKKAIVAPFSGVLGIRQVNLGQFLPEGTPIVTLQSLNRLHADFTLPEQYLDRVRPGQQVALKVATWPDRTFTGRVNAVSVKVEPSSHNFAVQAVVENPDRLLKPGLFADVEVMAGEPREVVAVPKPAISYSLYGDAVYIVTEDGRDEDGEPILQAHQRFVRVGEAQGEWVSVLEGVEPGERVVTAGQLKLRDGARVNINNEVALTDGPDEGSGDEAAGRRAASGH